MILAKIKEKIIPATLFLVLFSMISVFVSYIGSPTNKAISNNSDFQIESSYLITPVNESIHSILLTHDSFIASAVNEVPWSFEQHAYWLKIVIKNDSKEMTNLISHFDNAMLDELSIFQVNKLTEVIKQEYLGDHKKGLVLAKRTIPHFNFEIGPLEKTTLYIRIATTGIANTPVHIYHSSDFEMLVQKIHLLWGVFIGATIFIALYNLVLFFAAKDFVYLIYNGYILSSVSLLGVVLGYGFYVFPEQIQLIFNMHVIALNFAIAIFTLLFLVNFLKFQQHKQWQYWSAIVAVYVLSVLLIISFWLPEYLSAPLFFTSLPVVYIICCILLITKIHVGLEWGILYIYSWVPLLIGAAIQPLVLMGIIEYSFLSHHAFMIAVLIEVVLMAMALADRMRYQKEQVIYHATYDMSSKLPNQTLLESNLTKLISSKKEFASCLIEIENYQILAPYLPSKALQKLELQIIKDITPILAEEIRVYCISEHDKKKFKLAKIVGGQLMFIVETSDKELLTTFIKKLQKNIIKELQLNGLLIELKTNVGVCFNAQSRPEITANEFIQHSRLAIEKNRKNDDYLHCYHDLEVLNIKEHLALACDLQTAIRDNQINLYHQPQIDLKTGKIYGSETLLRWQHPEHGFISPEIFVGIAEDTGLINELTRWVIDRAFKQLKKLHVHNHLLHKVSINISAKDICLPNFLSYVEAKMIELNIPRDVITFELTESVMVTDFTVLDNLMVSLSELGINVSIDDYGTGYSSLNYISQLKFDELKIDKAFILDLDSSTRNLAIVKATIEMAKNLNLKVIAEGVESRSIEQKLIESGCDISQGFYYSQPLSFDKYLLWLNTYTPDTSI